MNVKYINPFLDAVKNTFRTAIFLPLDIGVPRVKKSKRTTHATSGFIKLSGDVTGCFAISLAQSTAIKIASALSHKKLEQLDGRCVNAIFRWVMMIAGEAKNLLDKENIKLFAPELALIQQPIDIPEGLPLIMIPCETQKNKFSIEIGIELLRN